jgi:hypothetical protein
LAVKNAATDHSHFFFHPLVVPRRPHPQVSPSPNLLLTATIDGVPYAFGGDKACELQGCPPTAGEGVSSAVDKFFSVDVPDVFLYVRKSGDYEPLELREAILSRFSNPPGGFTYGGYLFAGSGYWYQKPNMGANGTALAAIVGPRKGHAAVVARASATARPLVYLIGGMDEEGNVLSSTVVFDPLTETYAAGPDLPFPLWKHSAVVSADGTRIYVAGGSSSPLAPHSSAPLAALVLNLAVGSAAPAWQSTGQAPQESHADGCAALTDNGRLFLIGGYQKDDVSGQALGSASVEIYDTNRPSQPFVTVTSAALRLPLPRGDLACAAVGRTIYLAGGFSSREYPDPSDPAFFLAYNTDRGVYTALPPMATPRGSVLLLPTADRSLLAIGGEVVAAGGAGLVPSSAIEEYLIDVSVWGMYSQSGSWSQQLMLCTSSGDLFFITNNSSEFSPCSSYMYTYFFSSVHIRIYPNHSPRCGSASSRSPAAPPRPPPSSPPAPPTSSAGPRPPPPPRSPPPGPTTTPATRGSSSTRSHGAPRRDKS